MIQEYAFLLVPAAAILAVSGWVVWLQVRDTRRYDAQAKPLEARRAQVPVPTSRTDAVSQA